MKTTIVIDQLFLELSQVTQVKTYKESVLLDAVQSAYKKHCLKDDSIAWSELDSILLDALCEVMGDEGYQTWVKEVKKTL